MVILTFASVPAPKIPQQQQNKLEKERPNISTCGIQENIMPLMS